MNAPDLKLVAGNPLLAAGQSKFHESARAQVAGAATYIDDLPELRGTLHAAPVCSPVAHGRLLASSPSSLPCATGAHTGAACSVPRSSGMSSM
jgi:xanthine dehydrogenase large subunit